MPPRRTISVQVGGDDWRFLEIAGRRHTHATILMLQNVHPKLVSERLGHADIGITLRTYSHVLPSMESQVAEIFAAAVAPAERADEGGVL